VIGLGDAPVRAELDKTRASIITEIDSIGAIAVEIARAKDAEISALRQIARNLATTLELHQLGGIASLRQQMKAHGLNP
jgi:hypothetical protein